MRKIIGTWAAQYKQIYIVKTPTII
ncbi:hypothetical protein BGLA2_3050017 [Burkholderia gladioli]|nr:hypothetical protein BGLA2_3050017 [Burkholderia gladioli]